MANRRGAPRRMTAQERAAARDTALRVPADPRTALRRAAPTEDIGANRQRQAQRSEGHSPEGALQTMPGHSRGRRRAPSVSDLVRSLRDRISSDAVESDRREPKATMRQPGEARTRAVDERAMIAAAVSEPLSIRRGGLPAAIVDARRLGSVYELDRQSDRHRIARAAEGTRVSGNFFPLLGLRPLLGRAIEEQDENSETHVTVLTHGLWMRRFGGDPNILGRGVYLNGLTYVVVGVLPPGFMFPFRDAEMAVPLSLRSDARRADRGANFLRVLARLSPGVT